MLNLLFYEDCVELALPRPENLDLNTLNWLQYNPRKNINRWGCSITSLDGGDSGVPDLDSVLEYNTLNGTNYTEKDFKVPTRHAEPFADFLAVWPVGRSHYLKFTAGGFFPWHRDGDPHTFRLIYTIKNCTPNNLIWLEDDKILNFHDQSWYYINTKKKHALFSLNEENILAVFNVVYNGLTHRLLNASMKIK